MTLEVDPSDSHDDSHACVAGVRGRQRVEDGNLARPLGSPG